MKPTSHSGAKSLLLTFLALYAIITLVPAAVYGASHWSKEAKPNMLQPPASSPDTVTAAPSTSSSPSSTPPPTMTASPIPDFLAGLQMPDQSGQAASASPSASPAVFVLEDSATGETLQVPEREFLAAAIACEMDLASPEEALNAQAVAAYTYYSRQRQQPIHCDTANWLVYVPESSMEERWGEDFSSYKAILDTVVDQVFGQTLQYNGQLALTSYFAISPGSTENVENVWGTGSYQEHPYLQAVASPGDCFSDGYLSTLSLSEEELRDAVTSYFSDDIPDLSGSPDTWLTDIEYTPSHLVKTAQLGGKTVTGSQLRSALGLRSAGFQFTLEEGVFHFTVHGWGHCVGMSQAGAVFLAKRGASYQEILQHYYPGTELVSG